MRLPDGPFGVVEVGHSGNRRSQAGGGEDMFAGAWRRTDGETRGDETMRQDQDWADMPEWLGDSAPMSAGRAETRFDG